MLKPILSISMKRRKNKMFRVGSAEMIGRRPSMEYSNAIVLKESWGFFGVFDGHGGSACSEFVSERLTVDLAGRVTPPADDEEVKKMMLDLDMEWLEKHKDSHDDESSSGTTGTFVFVEHASAHEESKKAYRLRVGNVGDSRVLLGNLESCQIVPGRGTDGGLTKDHKPDDPEEKKRIEDADGKVTLFRNGIARVDGLAVSRAFGDKSQKEDIGSDGKYIITAEPEFETYHCGEMDFLMLVCDGISEGKVFPFLNGDVVRFAAERLNKQTDPDPAEVAAAVCRQALEAGSKDNLSCMIVLLGGGPLLGEEDSFIPGPYDCFNRTAYERHVKHAGKTLEEVVERRYNDLVRELKGVQVAKRSPLGNELELKLEKYTYDLLNREQLVQCDGCKNINFHFGRVHRCAVCDFDLCEDCYSRPAANFTQEDVFRARDFASNVNGEDVESIKWRWASEADPWEYIRKFTNWIQKNPSGYWSWEFGDEIVNHFRKNTPSDDKFFASVLTFTEYIEAFYCGQWSDDLAVTIYSKDGKYIFENEEGRIELARNGDWWRPHSINSALCLKPHDDDGTLVWKESEDGDLHVAHRKEPSYDLKKELHLYRGGPPSGLTPEQRRQWFTDWLYEAERNRHDIRPWVPKPVES